MNLTYSVEHISNRWCVCVLNERQEPIRVVGKRYTTDSEAIWYMRLLESMKLPVPTGPQDVPFVLIAAGLGLHQVRI